MIESRQESEPRSKGKAAQVIANPWRWQGALALVLVRMFANILDQNRLMSCPKSVALLSYNCDVFVNVCQILPLKNAGRSAFNFCANYRCGFLPLKTRDMVLNFAALLALELRVLLKTAQHLETPVRRAVLAREKTQWKFLLDARTESRFSKSRETSISRILGSCANPCCKKYKINARSAL